MPTLLLQSCSASKNEVQHPTSALELYSGYFYKIIKKAKREGAFRSDLDIAILSAKHGVLTPEDEIAHYDQRMDEARARALNESVVEALTTRIEDEGYDRVVVNMGSTYRSAIAGLEDRVPAKIVEIHGGGIGEKGSVLRQFIRGDDAAIEVTASV